MHFAPHEVLEMLLYRTIPRRNTNPMAHAILEEAGTLENIPIKQPAVKGVGRKTKSMLSSTFGNMNTLMLQDLNETVRWSRELFYMVACYYIRRMTPESILMIECDSANRFVHLHSFPMGDERRLAEESPAYISMQSICYFAMCYGNGDVEGSIEACRKTLAKIQAKIACVLFLDKDGFTPRRWIEEF